jgi:multiple sugar transport system ATP-binding protein
MLRMIAGLEEITSGEIFIDGKLVNNVSPKDRDIAMVFQNYALYPHMTVFENIAFGLKLRKFSNEEIKKRVEEAAAILDLQDYLERKPRQLSGGQRQRVAVGRAIVRKPKVFLFDEPLSNLDAKLRVQMRTEISRLHKNLDATMIYVTHDQTEAMTMGDRIVILKDGEVQQTGTPMELYNNPVNKFVAGFIGSPSMNFLKGKIIAGNGLLFVSQNEELKINLRDSKSLVLNKYDNKTVEIGIRPEHFKVAQPNLPSVVNVKLDVVEPMGNESFLYFQLEGQQFIARISVPFDLKAGQQIQLQIGTDNIYFFDTDTGITLAEL